MKRIMAVVLSMTLVGSVIAAQAQDAAAPATTTTKSARRKMAAKPPGPTVSSQLSEMKQAIDAQQAQIKQLSELIQKPRSKDPAIGTAARSEPRCSYAGADQGGYRSRAVDGARANGDGAQE